MGHKIITDLTAAASVADSTEMEVQVSGETVTKKATISQITETEKNAREAQDDVIEASVGLGTDGSYPTDSFVNSWYLRDSDFGSIVDRLGTTGSLPINLANALRVLDYRLHSINQLLVAEVTLTAAEIKDLHNNSKVLVEHEDGYVIDVLSVTGFLDYTAPAYANMATDKLKFGHMGGYPMFEITNNFYVATADKIFRALPSTEEELTISADFTVYCDSAITTGNSTMKFNVVYRKLPV